MILQQTYTEVYEVLQVLGRKYINKLPPKLYEFIEEQRDEKSIFEININEDIKNQPISEEATDFIAYLNLEYWCNQEEKEKLIYQYKENDIKYEKELREKYSEDNLFKKADNEKDEGNQHNEIIEYKKFSLKRILRKIFKFIK